MTLYERCVRALLRAYKLTLSPLIGRQCRFVPTCSEYAAEALIGHGPWRGSALAAGRLCRCHPWSGKSGYDPVPPPRKKGPDGQKPEGPARTWTCET
ncbi:MAG: membrane protein insertion efficiency factor YidD [Proteobacteria bacterium]|nr:membrane protein insertion efficiency factor YidD [Pseudomonadota bacterium]